VRTPDRLIVGTVLDGSLSAALPSLLLAPFIILLSFLPTFPLSPFSLFNTLPIGASSLFLALPLVAFSPLRFCFQQPCSSFSSPVFDHPTGYRAGENLSPSYRQQSRGTMHPRQRSRPRSYRLRSRSRPAACWVGESASHD
jgi:hypothetical protein